MGSHPAALQSVLPQQEFQEGYHRWHSGGAEREGRKLTVHKEETKVTTTCRETEEKYVFDRMTEKNGNVISLICQ